MNNKILIIAFFILLNLIILGIYVPQMISSDSSFLVLLGIILSFLVALANLNVLLYFYKKIKKISDEKTKKEE